jgi:uncharacterized protein
MVVAAAGLGLLIGVVIGGLGGGGGVLTVPVLVYLLGQSAQHATTSSLIIVGITATAGALARVRDGSIRWRTGLGFGAVGLPAALLGTLLNQRVAEPVLLLAFAGLTLLAATAMLISSSDRSPATEQAPDPEATGDPEGSAASSGSGSALAAATRVRALRQVLATGAKVVLSGLLVGFLTGFLGVGGGFLIVPALVIVLGIPMSSAIGTSLLVIAVNSAASLASRAGVAEFDWAVIVPFSLAAIIGTFAGKRISDRLSGAALSRSFAVMLLAVGVFVAVRSLLAL